jgi:hypothetical protein
MMSRSKLVKFEADEKEQTYIYRKRSYGKIVIAIPQDARAENGNTVISGSRTRARRD